jgi:Protein of unknown function (DUF3995)
VLAFASAVPSFVWGCGIHGGVRSVGRDMASYTWSNHAKSLVFMLFTGCLKVMGGLFALALVRPRWPLPHRSMTLIVGNLAAVVLTLYGLQDIVLRGLLEIHVIPAPGRPDWFATRWRLGLWGPSFTVWGILLGLAVRRYGGTSQPAIAAMAEN